MELEPLSKQTLLSFLQTFSPTKTPPNRSSLPYINLSSSFLMPETKNFTTQYCHLYYVRLMKMKENLFIQLKAQNYTPISILTLPKSQICCVIGVLYKEMMLKPNILQRIGGLLDNTPSLLTSYFSKNDLLYIEDENGRVKLDLTSSKITIESLCSGLVVGLLGIYDGKTFMVNDMIFPGFYLKEIPIITFPKSLIEVNDNSYIAFISGLNIDGAQESIDYHINWLKQLFYGNITNRNLSEVLSRVNRLVIAGNSIKKEALIESLAFMGAAKAQELYNKLTIEIKKSIGILDEFIAEISQHIAVDLFSGDNEPNTNFFPFQPLNKTFFQKSYRNKHFTAVTNPYCFQLEGKRILGTSGINIQDLRKSCLNEERDINLLENTLKWGHFAPTIPETLRFFLVFTIF